MAANKLPEVWQRGPVPGIPPLLQPIAHALLQAREEVTELLIDFDSIHLHEQPAALASPAFHLQHLTGILNRLFTYARGRTLNDDQLAYLKQEGTLPEKPYNTGELVQAFSAEVDKALTQLSETDEAVLNEVRGVGRAQIPSTVIGLYVHAAEHTMRHVGQLLVTVKIIKFKL